MRRLLVILVGKAGVGKTVVRGPLAKRLKARALGPDDHPYRWDWAVRQLDTTQRVILECCQIPRAVRARMDAETVVVELVASESARKWRLQQQGHDPEEVARRLAASSDGLGWEDAIQATISIDVTTAAPQLVAKDIAERVGQPALCAPHHGQKTNREMRGSHERAS